MTPFIKRANLRRGLTFSQKQLASLNTILNGANIEVVKKELLAMHDFSLEPGLAMLVRSRVARPTYKALVVKRLVSMAARGDRQRLRTYAKVKRNPPLMRIGAAQALLRSRDPADRSIIKAILDDPKDLMGPALRRFMSGAAAQK